MGLTDAVFLGESNLESQNRMILPDEVMDKLFSDEELIMWGKYKEPGSHVLPVLANSRSLLTDKNNYTYFDHTDLSDRATITADLFNDPELELEKFTEGGEDMIFYHIAPTDMLMGDERGCFLLIETYVEEVISGPDVWDRSFDNLSRVTQSSLPDELKPELSEFEKNSEERFDQNPERCELCVLYTDDSYCELGEDFTESIIEMEPSEIPGYIRQKQETMADEYQFKLYHDRVHKALDTTAFVGFCSHLIRSLPLLVAFLEWQKENIEEDISSARMKRFSKAIRLYYHSDVYDEDKDSLLEHQRDPVIGDIYDKKNQLTRAINSLEENPQDVTEINDAINTAEGLNELAVEKFNKYLFEFMEKSEELFS